MTMVPSANPPNYSAQRTNAQSSTLNGGLRVQPMSGGFDVGPGNPLPVSASVAPVGATTLTTSQVSVGSAATAIVAAEPTRVSVTIVNAGTTVVYLGPAGVTTATGVPLAGVLGAAVTFNFTGALFGVVATGTQTVGVADILQ